MDEPRFAVVVERFFDGERFHAGAQTLRVADGKLLGVEPGDRQGELAAQDGPVERGALLLPGLVDAHAHLFLDPAATDPARRAAHLKRPPEQLVQAARQHARDAAAWGVTLVRDAGDRHGINHRIRAEAARPGSGLPRVRSVGRGIKRARCYGAFMGSDVGDADNLARVVEELATSCDEIKLILTGVIDFAASGVTDTPQFTAAEARLAVAAAHYRGRKVMAHCNGPEGLALALNAGVDSIEHGFFMDRSTLARLRDRNVAWTPTLSPVHFQWAHPKAVRWPAHAVDNMRRALDAHSEQLRMAHELGVRVLVGTGAGSMGVPHGRGVFEEMWHLLDAGLPLEAVLRAATGTPRRHFDDPWPRLAAGAPFGPCCSTAPFVADARCTAAARVDGGAREPVAPWRPPLRPRAVMGDGAVIRRLERRRPVACRDS